MKYLIFFIVVMSMTYTNKANSQSWQSYYVEFTPKDETLQQFKFPEPSNRQKKWRELNRKEKKQVKQHLRTHYGVNPSNRNYLVESLSTTGRSVLRVAVYVITMGAAAIVVGGIINKQP